MTGPDVTGPDQEAQRMEATSLTDDSKDENIKPGWKRVVVGAIPIIGDTLLVFVKSKKGKWIFPKGGAKKGEELYVAARREAYEEAGVIGETEKEALCEIQGIKFFIMKVFEKREVYGEAKRRERTVMEPETALNDEGVSRYVKRVVKEMCEWWLREQEKEDDWVDELL